MYDEEKMKFVDDSTTNYTVYEGSGAVASGKVLDLVSEGKIDAGKALELMAEMNKHELATTKLANDHQMAILGLVGGGLSQVLKTWKEVAVIEAQPTQTEIDKLEARFENVVGLLDGIKSLHEDGIEAVEERIESLESVGNGRAR